MGKSKYLGIVIRDYSVFANQQLQILLQYHNFPSSEQIDLQHLAWFPYCRLHLVSNHRAVGIFKRWVPLLHPYDYHAMLVTDVVHRNHSWVGELAASLPLLETCMTASLYDKNNLQDGGIQVSFSSGILGPYFRTTWYHHQKPSASGV